ncbi:MAG: DnaJ domain-containing protein, partial [Alphaproteobacteria bacterium]|nr:DnaJ domain-containing protein [Alphaproteobacteria bacterium]
MQSLYDKRLDLTADQILGIQFDQPEVLFLKDSDCITSAYRELVRKWHPDRNKAPESAEVFDHLTKLRTQADEKLANGTWQEAGFFTCRLKDGNSFRVHADASRPFELGTMYLGPT